MPDINFPSIDLTINDVSFSDVPPEYIREFVFTDRWGGAFDVEFLLHDVEYTDLEDVLFAFNPNDKKNTLVTRFGYILNGQPFLSDTLRCAVSHYLPVLRAGVEARIRAYALGVHNNIITPTKRSFVNFPYHEVVEEITKDMFGSDADLTWIQRTREDSPLFTGGTEGFNSLFKFLKEKIEPRAEDPEGKTGFTTRYGWSGESIIFGTAEWIAQRRLDFLQSLPVFTWLRGEADSDVIEFKPDFNSKLLGGYGQAGITNVGWDKLTKRPLVIPVNPTSAQRLNRQQKYLAKGASTVSLGKDITNQEIEGRGTELRRRILGEALDTGSEALFDLFFGDAKTIDNSADEAVPRTIKLELSESEIEIARASAFERWTQLQQTAVEAELTLNGSEKTVRMRAGDLIRVIVIIPRTEQIHWSSGLWYINEIRHEITTNYRVVCQLIRNSNAQGVEDLPDNAKIFAVPLGL